MPIEERDPSHPSDLELPYGTFEYGDYYHYHMISSSKDPNDAAWEWDEYVVPGLGMVMMVDYSADDPPMIMELVRIVPEPSTLALLAMGAFGLLFRYQRRRKV